jgi:putative phosphoesterase
MRVGILSDTHGNHVLAARALDLLTGRRAEVILHAGDIGDDLTVAALAGGPPAHLVLGNCDPDAAAFAGAAAAVGATLHGRFADLTLDGKRVALLHGDDHRRLQEAAAGGQYDYVIHGHTHQKALTRQGQTVILNPGALHRARPKTVALLDTATGEVEWITVAE